MTPTASKTIIVLRYNAESAQMWLCEETAIDRVQKSMCQLISSLFC